MNEFWKYYKFLKTEQMGACNSKTKDTNQGFQVSDSIKNGSSIRITIKRKTGIYSDPCCPIQNEKIQEIQKLLDKKDIQNSNFLQVRGQYDPIWQKIKTKEFKGECWYVGQWLQGTMNGRGNVYSKHSDFLIKGNFVQGVLSKTYCIKILSDGSYYIGCLNDTLDPEGFGELHYYEGNSKYVGQFSAGVPHGKGKIITTSYIFEGQFKKGERHHGVLQEENGIYIGEFVNNAKEGKGKFMFKNGKIFEGYFQNNKFTRQDRAKKTSKKVTFKDF